MASRPCRRDLLTALALGGVLPLAGGAARRQPARPVSFLVVSDTHYLADAEVPERLDPRSRDVTGRFVDLLNGLPGSPLPETIGGGVVPPLAGVLHTGDIIDSGDKRGDRFERMQRTEWAAFEADFGCEAGDGRLAFPMRELHGNHDGPQGEGPACDGIAARNRRRRDLTNVSDDGLLCSWDWGDVHFVSLGIVVGAAADAVQRRRYAPRGSLAFLAADLAAHVGASGRPVVLAHHIDIARAVRPCSEEDPDGGSREWHPCDARAFHAAIDGVTVAGIFYGHTHARAIHAWNGTALDAADGLPVYNVDNASHFGGGQQAFFLVTIDEAELTLRECATADGWRTHGWTPQMWRRPLRRTS